MSRALSAFAGKISGLAEKLSEKKMFCWKKCGNSRKAFSFSAAFPEFWREGIRRAKATAYAGNMRLISDLYKTCKEGI